MQPFPGGFGSVMEDKGETGVAHREPLQASAAELKVRTGPTIFIDRNVENDSRRLKGVQVLQSLRNRVAKMENPTK